MKIIVCPDSFKGSLSAAQAADAIARGVRRAVPGTDVVQIPLADGGEGTLDALVKATAGRVRRVPAHDPLMRPIEASYGILGDGKTAVVETAAASGLTLLAEPERNPLITTTYGTGELIGAALDSGVTRIILAIGGSATNDGGAGAMTALGARFLDANGRDLPPGGGALAGLARIDVTGFRFPVGKAAVEAACDVTNPLCGPNGASAVFGPQKGATPEMVRHLDQALCKYAQVIYTDLNKDVANLPGAGAAGGFGAGLAAFLDARLRSGIDIVLDAVHFDDALGGAGLVITGEGRLDEQTAAGKTIAGVVRRTSALGIPTVALAGMIQGSTDAIPSIGLTGAYSIVENGVTPEYAMGHAAELLEELACRAAARLIH